MTYVVIPTPDDVMFDYVNCSFPEHGEWTLYTDGAGYNDEPLVVMGTPTGSQPIYSYVVLPRTRWNWSSNTSRELVMSR